MSIPSTGADDTGRPRPVMGRVLFLADDQALCLLTHFALSRAGVDVDVSTNPTEAFRLLQADKPDYGVLVLDRDPRGFPVGEMVARLRVRHPEVAVAVVAASFDVRSARFDAWVERPYTPEQILAAVHSSVISRERRQGRSTAS